MSRDKIAKQIAMRETRGNKCLKMTPGIRGSTDRFEKTFDPGKRTIQSLPPPLAAGIAWELIKTAKTQKNAH
jgi:hypothetical protein